MLSEETSDDDDALLTYEIGPDESFTHAVISAVAEATDREKVATPVGDGDSGGNGLSPLYAAVDSDALESILAPRPVDSRQGDVTVSFTYEDVRVNVESFGLVRVKPLRRSEESDPE